jgi:hypothetical protein
MALEQETSDDLEKRREEVEALIRRGVDSKLLMGMGEPAEKFLRLAHRRALSPTPLPSPFPELASYRLAQLLMRTARTEKELKEVDKLLAAVIKGGDIVEGGTGPLGVMPICLRAIAQMRLSSLDKRERRESIEALMSKAVRSIAIERRRRPEELAVQSSTFNLLELTAYMIGMQYDLLEGVGISLGPFGREVADAWIIVGSAGEIRPVRMPKEFARAEVEDRVRRRDAHLGYIAGTDSDTIIWRDEDGRLLVDLAESPELKLVPALCVGAPRKRLVPAGQEGNVRAYISDLRKDLAGRLARSKDEIVASDGRSKNERFHPGLRVACAFAERRLTDVGQ